MEDEAVVKVDALFMGMEEGLIPMASMFLS
jgi:hypothetical protein